MDKSVACLADPSSDVGSIPSISLYAFFSTQAKDGGTKNGSRHNGLRDLVYMDHAITESFKIITPMRLIL